MSSIEDNPIEVRAYQTNDGYIAWQWGNIGIPSDSRIIQTFWLHKGEFYQTDYGYIHRDSNGNMSLYDYVYDVHTTACIDEPKITGEVVNVKV